MTMRTPLRQPETSDERLTAIETYLPHLATREYVERALREQSDMFRETIMKQTADMQAQMRSDRRWTIGTIVTVGLALAGLIIRMSG